MRFSLYFPVNPLVVRCGMCLRNRGSGVGFPSVALTTSETCEKYVQNVRNSDYPFCDTPRLPYIRMIPIFLLERQWERRPAIGQSPEPPRSKFQADNAGQHGMIEKCLNF